MQKNPKKIENLSFTVWETDAGDLELKSVDLFYPGGQTRMYFNAQSRLMDMLVPEFASEIFANLSDGLSSTRINTFPDFAFQAETAAVFKMRALISASANGRRKFILRFKYVLGDLQELFATPITIAFPEAYQRDRVCTEVLGDIALPLLNLISNGGDDETHDRLVRSYQGLQMRSDELKFYISLLTRYTGAASNFGAGAPLALPMGATRH